MQKFKFLSKDKKTNNDKNDELKHNASADAPEKKLVSRNAVICSSGKDKYHYDSERAEVPTRTVDAELEGTSLLQPSLGSDRNLHSSQISFTSSLANVNHSDHLQVHSPTPTNHNHTNCVPRNSVVKRYTMTPSLFVNGKFQNPWPNYKPPTFTSILKLGFSSDKSVSSTKHNLDDLLPLFVPYIENKPAENTFRITWIGHSTLLAEFDNISVLTDPIFSERASPSQVIGPKRYRNPPCTVFDLPPDLDAVVISHSHYDHLDLNTVVMLNARFGNDLRWFIPLGLGDWFNRLGCENVVELDWWEENCVADKNDVSFIFTPSQHWSKRTLTDDNKSLWGSWVVKGPRFRFFFAGDTGYCDIFKEIGHFYGPFDVSAIPIGAYEPRFCMKHQHVNSTEAVKIHKDIKSKFSIGIHWGTFSISNEPFLDPPIKLKEALKQLKVNDDRFVTFNHGETRQVNMEGIVQSCEQRKIV